VSHSANVDGLRYNLRESCQPPRAPKPSPKDRWIEALKLALDGRERGLARARANNPNMARVVDVAHIVRTLQLALRFMTSRRTMRTFEDPQQALDAFFAEESLRDSCDVGGFRKNIIRTTLDVLEPH
jgi:hypothetical protein